MNQIKNQSQKETKLLSQGGHQEFKFSWDVEKKPLLYYPTGYDNRSIIVENRHALTRTDNYKCLSIVSDRYTPFYNSRFAEIVNSFLAVGSDNPMIQEFDSGKKLSVQIQDKGIGTEALTSQILTDQEIKIDDKHKGYITMINSHDKTTPWLIGLTIVRIVCKNTFLMALQHLNDNALFQGKHLPNFEIKWEDIKTSIQAASVGMSNYLMQMEELKNLSWDKDDNFKFFNKTFRNMDLHPKNASTRLNNMIMEFDMAYDKYTKQVGGNNRYATFNAVTHVIDHNATEKQQARGWNTFGRGHMIKSRALNTLLS